MQLYIFVNECKCTIYICEQMLKTTIYNNFLIEKFGGIKFI